MADTPQLDRKGMADAIAHQKMVRELSFLPLTENVAGYELIPLTVEKYTILSFAGNPLLFGGLPSPEQLAQFLWLLSPQYTPQGGASKRRFLRRCREFFTGVGSARFFKTSGRRRIARASEIIEACRKYVFDAMADRPPSKPRANGAVEDAFCDACWFCAALGREYGYPQSEVMVMPLKRVFQFINEAKLHHDRNAPIRKVASEFTGKWLDELNAQAKKEKK